MFKRSLIAGAVLSVSLGAHAVGANISVTGTVTPDACTIALGNNGNVDYGTLTASVVRSYDLWFGTHYTLPNKDIAIEVNCPSATRVGLSVLDNRATTKENGLTRPGIKFGLGLSGTQPIGFYEIQTHSIQIGLTRGGDSQQCGKLVDQGHVRRPVDLSVVGCSKRVSVATQRDFVLHRDHTDCSTHPYHASVGYLEDIHQSQYARDRWFGRQSLTRRCDDHPDGLRLRH